MVDLSREFFNIRWPKGRPFQLVALGLNAVDWICFLPDYPKHDSKTGIETLYRSGGGQTATAAALCARYGLKTRYVGRVGDDETGQFSLRDLEKEPMDLSCVETIQGAVNQLAIVLVDRPTGERTILWSRDSKLHYRPGELDRAWITAGQILHMDGHDPEACVESARWAREAGMKVSVDVDKVQPGVEEVLKLADFAIPSLDFVLQFSRKGAWQEGLEEISKLVPGFVAVTLGKQGVAALWDGQIVEVPGFPVEPLDTTGSGDIFHGAFVYGLFQDWSAQTCLRFANGAASLSCTRPGARGGIPRIDEVFRLLEK